MRKSLECAYLLDVHNLTIGLLELLELGHEVPEAALGDHHVGGEDGHLKQRGLRILLCGQGSAHHHILVQLNGNMRRTNQFSGSISRT